MNWSLSDVLISMHYEVEGELAKARAVLKHAGTKGDASEAVWIDLFNRYLPRRYVCASVHVADSTGGFSEQIDVAIYDRQYSPFILTFKGQQIVPAESVYAVFEAKQTVNSALIKYAKQKAASVRRLRRTSLPIPTASGLLAAKEPEPIIAGVLALDSDWAPPLGRSFQKSLSGKVNTNSLDIGCVAAHGWFSRSGKGYEVHSGAHAVSRFIFELIAQLQAVATVPMIDVRAYARWLEK
jgi:uncharacterized protein DUF6602